MRFECKKAEDCFSNAENYEYRLEVPGLQFVEMLAPLADRLRINEQLRRPTFTASLEGGIQLKGLMDKTIIKVGFVPAQASEQRAAFEQWLATV